MKYYFFFFILFNYSVFSQVEKYKINDDVGLKLNKELTVIQKYDELMGVSEGIALLRKKNNYIYCKLNGEKILKTNADLAYPFKYGIAKIFLKSIPYLINKEGEVIYHNKDLRNIYLYEDCNIIITHDNKYGLLNKDFKVILAPVYSYISNFENGVAIIKGWEYSFKYGKSINYDSLPNTTNIGLIKPNGDFIIPFGRYISIWNNDVGQFHLMNKKLEISFFNNSVNENNSENNSEEPISLFLSNYYNQSLELDIDSCYQFSSKKKKILLNKNLEKDLIFKIIENKTVELEKTSGLIFFNITLEAFDKSNKKWKTLFKWEDDYSDHFYFFKSVGYCTYRIMNFQGNYLTKVRIKYSNELDNENLCSREINMRVNYKYFVE